MKKFLSIFAILLLSGCTATTSSISEETTVNATTSNETVDFNAEKNGSRFKTLLNEICSKFEINSVSTLSNKAILNTYGIDIQKLDDYIFAEPNAVEDIDTIIIVKCKENAYAEEIKETFNTMLEAKKDEVKNYNPEQFDIYNKSIINIKDTAVYWVVSNYSDEIAKEIDKNI